MSECGHEEIHARARILNITPEALWNRGVQLVPKTLRVNAVPVCAVTLRGAKRVA